MHTIRYFLAKLSTKKVPTTRKRTADASVARQGGIYNLPTHLSAGARDLIPRMLVVDPLKRITIPEIR